MLIVGSQRVATSVSPNKYVYYSEYDMVIFGIDMRGQKEDINSNNNTNTPFVSERVVVNFELLAGSPQEECILVLPPPHC